MSFILEKEIFYINSRDRLGGTNENFSYKLDIDKNKEYDKVVVLQASIPKSYYIVQENSNFILSEDGIEIIITIPIGNYNRNSFKNVVQSLLNTNSPNDFIYSITYENISITQDTGKYYFTVSNNSGIQPILIFSNKLFQQFGFDEDSQNQFSSDQLVSTNSINLDSESNIFIRSDICQNINSNNVLQEIYSSGNKSFSNILFINYNIDAYSKPFIPKSNIYNFYLTDEDNNLLFLNGQNVNLTIMIYKYNNTDALIRRIIKIVGASNLLESKN